MTSTIKVDKLDPQSGTALEIGTSGDTVTVPSGVGLTLTNATLLLPTTITSTTEVKTNKISPATGTAFGLGDSGDTFTVPSGATLSIPSGATITNAGTATGFGDTTAVENDIATLALHQATNANAAKYNLVNTNVDQFEDSTGVATFTDCARDSSGEYVSTISSSVEAFTSDSNTELLLHMETLLLDSSSAGHTMNNTSGCTRSSTQAKFGTYSANFDGTAGNSLYPDVSSDFTFGTGDWTIEMWFRPSGTGSGQGGFSYTSDVTAYPNCYFYRGTYPTFLIYVGNGSAWSPVHGASLATDATNTTWTHMAITRDGTNIRGYEDGVQRSATDCTGFNFTQNDPQLGDNPTVAEYQGYIDECRISDVCRYPDGTTFTPNLVETTNATGNFISTATTANASVTTMGGVITYTNTSGTAALNTDIILEVSADGGSNYTTATLTAGGTFATGILQTVANDITVTAGTSIQYRISFANQESGVKETRINGVSLMY